MHAAARTLSIVVLIALSQTSYAQNYPDRAIRMITSGNGSGVDFAARITAQALSPKLGQQVVVDNRPSGVIPGQTVARATPDGYSVLFYGSTVWIMPLLQNDVPYDPVKDFAPITKVASSPNIIVVHPSLPVKSVKDLIAFAKAHPGTLNDASVGTGSSTHLAAELFKSMAGVNIVRVPYKNGSTQMADLMSGQVQLAFATTGTVAPYVKVGRLRALAVTSAQPSALAPGLPTVAQSGLAGYESSALYVMFAPAKTPSSIIEKLNQETVRILQQPEVKEKFFVLGVEVVGSTPGELEATMKFEISKLGKIIKDAGIKPE